MQGAGRLTNEWKPRSISGATNMDNLYPARRHPFEGYIVGQCAYILYCIASDTMGPNAGISAHPKDAGSP